MQSFHQGRGNWNRRACPASSQPLPRWKGPLCRGRFPLFTKVLCQESPAGNRLQVWEFTGCPNLSSQAFTSISPVCPPWVNTPAVVEADNRFRISKRWREERKKGIVLQFTFRASFFVLLNDLYLKLDSRKKKAHVHR